MLTIWTSSTTVLPHRPAFSPPRVKTVRIIVITTLMFILGCTREDSSGWYLDSSFSVQLVTFSEEIPVILTQDPAKAVEVLQIFRSTRGKSDLDTVTEIRSNELVYETRNQRDILSLFRATRTGTKESCDSPKGDFTFSILAFDRDLMRVGYIRYFPCERNDLGWIQTPGSNSIYYSLETAKILNNIIPPSILRKISK